MGASSKNVAGPILVACAVWAMAGGRGVWLSAIGLAVSVGQLPGPEVSPPGLEDLDFFSPGVCRGGPEVCSAGGVQLGVGALPHAGVDPISVGQACVDGTGEGSFDGCCEVGSCVSGRLRCGPS